MLVVPSTISQLFLNIIYVLVFELKEQSEHANFVGSYLEDIVYVKFWLLVGYEF
jgi:hypothetical protein